MNNPLPLVKKFYWTSAQTAGPLGKGCDLHSLVRARVVARCDYIGRCGSLAGALYLGVLMGTEMMWLQPVAMILGVVMLSAISYVTLVDRRASFLYHQDPDQSGSRMGLADRNHDGEHRVVSCRNLPWAQQLCSKILFRLLGNPDGYGKIIVAVCPFCCVASVVVWFYNSGSKGIKAFELILKGMVGIVVLVILRCCACPQYEGRD